MSVHEKSVVERSGLSTLGVEETRLLTLLDRVFESWGTDRGAASMTMPPLLLVADLAKLDYYDNFPHHAVLASCLDPGEVRAGPRDAFPAKLLKPARLGLPSAACYAVYLHHQGVEVADGTTITVLGRCFRNEEHYAELRRLLGFHMREIVALGTREFTDRHLTTFTEQITAFAAELDLPLRREPATDPFYRRDGARMLMQQLAPVKHEFLFGDLPIASVNVHRTFFGERCDITLAGTGTPVSTSCVAFGLERWLAALRERFGTWDAAIDAVSRVSGKGRRP